MVDEKGTGRSRRGHNSPIFGVNCELAARRERVGRHHCDNRRLVVRDLKGKIGELA